MTVLAWPGLLLALLTAMATTTYLLRRYGAWVSGGAAMILAGIAWWMTRAGAGDGLLRIPFLSAQVQLHDATAWRGFVMQVTSTNLPVLVFSLLIGAAALLLAAFTRQSDAFPAFSLLVLAGYSGFAMLGAAPIEPYLLAPGFLALVTALSVYALQAGQLGDTTGPLRFLLMPVLAFPLFLLASWYIDRLALNPQDDASMVVAARLLSFGLLLLLGPAPLHTAWPAIAESAPPVAGVLLTLLYQLAVLLLLHRVATAHPFVVEQSGLNLWLTATGVLTAVWGGLAALGASHPGRLWGYAFLHEWGLILLILAAPGSRSWPLVLFLFVLRAVSGLTAAVGLACLRERVGVLSLEQLRGVGGRLPWNTTAYLLGSLGLAGFPLSAGFTGHWAALQTVAESDWRVAAVVLLASAGVVIGFVRLVRILFGPLGNPFLQQERPRNAIVALIAIALTASLAIAPQLLDGPISWGLAAFHG